SLTRSWVLQPTDFGLRVARLEDVVWVRKVIFQAVEPVARALTTVAFGVELKVKRGRDETFLTTREDADRLLAELLRRLPWVLSGVDSRWDDLWRQDRGRLFDSVQAQREQVQAGGPSGWEALAADKLRQALAQARTVAGERPGEWRA